MNCDCKNCPHYEYGSDMQKLCEIMNGLVHALVQTFGEAGAREFIKRGQRAVISTRSYNERWEK